MSCFFAFSLDYFHTQKPEDWPKPLFKALTYIYINFFSPTKSWVRNIEDNPKRDCQLPGREDGQIWRALDGGGGEGGVGVRLRGKGEGSSGEGWELAGTLYSLVSQKATVYSSVHHPCCQENK